MSLRLLFSIIFLFYFIPTYSQKGIEMQISTRTLEAGDPLRITYSIINQKVRTMNTTNFEPFAKIAGPSIAISESKVELNGRRMNSSTTSFTITLTTNKLGKIYVPKVMFTLSDGTRIYSSPIEIEVVKRGTGGNKNPFKNQGINSDPFSTNRKSGAAVSNKSGIYPDVNNLDLKNDIFARIEVDKKQCYVGEQLYASIKIYTCLNSKGFSADKIPNFNGFWSQNVPMPEHLEMKQEVINGKTFVVVETKRIILFPTKAGTLEISPLNMSTIALVPVAVAPSRNTRQPRDLLEAILMSMGRSENTMGVQFKEIPYSFSSGSVQIQVLPLPAGAPESFTGGVGKYTMTALSSKKDLKTDDALNFKLEIQGTGNLPLTEAPKANWSEAFEVYDPVLKENYSLVPLFSGTKTWEYNIIPHMPGSHNTPPLEFTYFDIEKKNYVTLTAPKTPLTITGNPTTAKEKGKKFGGINFSKQNIKQAQAYSKIINVSDKMVYGLGIFPLLLSFILGFIPKKEKKIEKYLTGKKISDLVMKHLLLAESHLKANNKEKFYKEMSNVYWNYFGHKFKMETSTLTRINIVEKMTDNKVNTTTSTKMISLIDTSEMGLYTNYGSQAMQELYDQSLEVLNDIERQMSEI